MASIQLESVPATTVKATHAIERALEARRSVREYAAAPLARPELAQLLWAAQGMTDPAGLRTAPSAGALYPLEMYVAAGDVSDLEPGVYHYAPRFHTLALVLTGDRRAGLAAAALGQECVALAPAVAVVAADYARTTDKYGERGRRYVHIEAGHAAQNLCLQAAALGLGTVVVGAFDDRAVARVAGLSPHHEPLLLLPVGRLT